MCESRTKKKMTQQELEGEVEVSMNGNKRMSLSRKILKNRGRKELKYMTEKTLGQNSAENDGK